VKALIDAGADVEARAKNGSTPLHFAAWRNAETVKALIDAGADPRQRTTEFGVTPLHAAAARGTAEMVKALIDAGADIKARDKKGRTPADLAEENDSVLNDPVFRVLNDARSWRRRLWS